MAEIAAKTALALLLVLAAGVASCAPSSGGADPTPRPDGGGGELVGPRGATLSRDGASVTIPPGALSSSVDIGVARLDDGTGLAVPVFPDTGERAEPLSPFYEFTPHGTRFARPVHVALEFQGTPSAVLRLDNRDDPSWEVLSDVVFGDGRAEFDIDGFSVYGVVGSSAPRSVCDRSHCGEGEVKACSETGASCWKPLAGVRVGPELGSSPNVFLTTSYAADLDRSRILPSYAVFVNSHVIGASETILSFFPLRADATAADVVQTKPFSMPYRLAPSEEIPAYAPYLMPRAVFPIEFGYLVVTLFGTHVALLHVTPDLPFWNVRELRPTIGYDLPYGHADWTQIDFTGVFAVRDTGPIDKLHIIASLNHPQGYADTTHRWTIPLEDSNFHDVSANLATVDTLEIIDAFPLRDEQYPSLYPVAVAPGPDNTLALLSHGQRVDNGQSIYDVQLQLWDVSLARRLVARSFVTAQNTRSGESVQSCSTSAVSTSGPSFGHIHAATASTAQAAPLGGAALLMSTQSNQLLYIGTNPVSTDVTMLGRCTNLPASDEHSIHTLLSARLMQDPRLEQKPQWHQAFSSVWTQASYGRDGSDYFATLLSPSTDSDELRLVEAWSEYAPSRFGLTGAVPTSLGHQLFATARHPDGGIGAYTLELNADGTFVHTANRD